MKQQTKDGAKCREQRLNKVLGDYLRAIEAGEAPDREELLRRHPELAEVLGDFFANWDRMEDMVGPLGAVPKAEEIADFHAAEAAGATSTVTEAPSLRRGGSPADYQLLEEIGRGGRGPVFRALHAGRQKVVAVKLIAASRLASGVEVNRLYEALERAARLSHRNVIRVYEAGEGDGHYYHSMDLVTGGSLDRHLARFGEDPRAAARLAAGVARGLAHAHAAGFVHADVRPANVLLGAEGQPVLTGFGVSDLALADAGLPPLGAIGLRLCYLAPEQLVGNQCVTAAADVYGLGAVLYEMLTGKPPHTADTPLAVLEHVVSREPEPIRAARPNVPAELEALVARCMQKERSRRPSSAAEVAEELERFAKGRTSPRPAPSRNGIKPAAATPARPPRPRRRWQVAAAGIAGIALAGALGYHIDRDVLDRIRAERDWALEAQRAAAGAADSLRAERDDGVREAAQARMRETEARAVLRRTQEEAEAVRAEAERLRQGQQLAEQAEHERAEAAARALREKEDAEARLTRERQERQEAERRLAEAEASRNNELANIRRREERPAAPPDSLARGPAAPAPEVARELREAPVPVRPVKFAPPDAAPPDLPAAEPSQAADRKPPAPPAEKVARPSDATPREAPELSPGPAEPDAITREALSRGAALITVLTRPGADLTVQGERVHRAGQHGARRVFLTPSLESDEDTHFYEIEVAWSDGGRAHRRHKLLPVEPGGVYTVDLRP